MDVTVMKNYFKTMKLRDKLGKSSIMRDKMRKICFKEI